MRNKDASLDRLLLILRDHLMDFLVLGKRVEEVAFASSRNVSGTKLHLLRHLCIERDLLVGGLRLVKQIGVFGELGGLYVSFLASRHYAFGLHLQVGVQNTSNGLVDTFRVLTSRVANHA